MPTVTVVTHWSRPRGPVDLIVVGLNARLLQHVLGTFEKTVYAIAPWASREKPSFSKDECLMSLLLLSNQVRCGITVTHDSSKI
ncbi:hypothetical protein [Variovorax guangxiensis]|uniref:hypothetical protein n=1 Tax=Variovorax guangxiensis TaxID=1775474 RepID=UPI001404E42C|nr:hypothetical protein [Variovorax guangxiensis]